MAQKPNGRLRLAYVGQFVEERKRISEVTRALCRVVREVEGTEAFIYGDGPDRQSVEQILQKEANGLAVHLVGFVENDQIRKDLLDCHAIVLLSDHEGLGLSLLEGMAFGVVPIGLRAASGLTEFVTDNVTGLLVSNRGDDFIAAVRRLQKDPLLWERLSRSARAHVQTEYSDEICIARWQELFQTLLDSSDPRKLLRIPSRLRLPPVHPALGETDRRKPPPHERAIARIRSFFSGIKNAMFQ
jgi:glycosyltransferase involved in cell wall biosynthesis